MTTFSSQSLTEDEEKTEKIFTKLTIKNERGPRAGGKKRDKDMARE